jgi:hypothetical protein
MSQFSAANAFANVPLPTIDQLKRDLPTIKYEEDPKWGGARERVNGYFLDPDRKGAVVIPSANDNLASGLQLSGFNPHGPQQQNVIDDFESGNVLEVRTTGRGSPPLAPPAAQPVTGVMTVQQAVQWAQQPLNYEGAAVPPMGQPLLVDATYPTPQSNGLPPGYYGEKAAEDIFPPRPQQQRSVLSTSPPPQPPPAGAKNPRCLVSFELPGMTLRQLYHEVIINEICLVLIWDQRCTVGNPPPQFQQNEEDKPFRIRVGEYYLVCNYFGQTFTDELQREYVIFTIDLAQSGRLEQKSDQGQQPQDR